MPPNRLRAPRRRASDEPPKVMTWGRALPVLAVGAIFDALRFMFSWFILFGPALGTAACAYLGSDSVGTSLAVAGCSLAGAAVGVAGSEFFGLFGVVMAMATGIAGWLAVVLILLITDRRIFSENIVWFGASLIVSETPFVGSLPAITFVLWRLYRNQIKIERAAYKKWQAANQKRIVSERRQLAEAQQEEILGRLSALEAANDEAMYAQQSANDEVIPESFQRAA